MRTILPAHSPVDADELMAIVIMEEFMHQPFYKSEKPDIYSGDKKNGVEVTRAYLSEYEEKNGKLMSALRLEEQTGVIETSPSVISYSASICENMSRMQERIVDKMQKLPKYEKYPFNYLYILTSIQSSLFELHKLPEMFDSLKEQILKQCDAAGTEYKCFDVLVIKCADTFFIWDWNNNLIQLRPNLYQIQQAYCPYVFRLIDQELDTGTSAVENTPFKFEKKQCKILDDESKGE